MERYSWHDIFGFTNMLTLGRPLKPTTMPHRSTGASGVKGFVLPFVHVIVTLIFLGVFFYTKNSINKFTTKTIVLMNKFKA